MTPPRRRLWLTLQAALALGLAAAVGWHFWKLLQGQPLAADSVRLRPGPLVAAGCCYLAAHALWGTFFWQLLRAGRGGVAWLPAVRAYFVSQAGKYAPGKAWVILIRMLLLGPLGARPALVGVSGTYETLTTMAAGALIGVALLPWSGWGLAVGSVEWLGFLALAALPLGLGLSNGLLVKLLRRVGKSADLPAPPVALLAQGLAQAALGWLLLGASAGLTLVALVPDPNQVAALDARGVLAAVALSYVAGFAALIVPGGLGARELLLQTMLAAQLAAAEIADAAAVSVVAAVALRLVWTVAELLLGAALWALVKPTPVPAPALAAAGPA